MNMPPMNRFKPFDVREIIQRGGEPFPEIRSVWTRSSRTKV